MADREEIVDERIHQFLGCIAYYSLKDKPSPIPFISLWNPIIESLLIRDENK